MYELIEDLYFLKEVAQSFGIDLIDSLQKVVKRRKQMK